jgi:hypothetical protein
MRKKQQESAKLEERREAKEIIDITKMMSIDVKALGVAYAEGIEFGRRMMAETDQQKTA